MKYLKLLVVGCATAITAFKLYLDGDGLTLTALFTLYGAILGSEFVAKTANQKDV